MDMTAATLRWQRWLVLVTLVGTSWVMWSPGTDHYALPQGTFLVIGAIGLLWLTAIRWIWTRRIVVPRSPVLVVAAVFALGIAIATLTSTARLQSLVGQHTQYTGLAVYVAGV